MKQIIKRAEESRVYQIDAAIHRFRECGVEIERFSIMNSADYSSTTLCVDGIPRFQWTLVNPDYWRNW